MKVDYFSRAGIDRWTVETALDRRRQGFFLELGALDGMNNSDTLTLERSYGWDGICIEANPNQFGRLARNRSCSCVNACVDSHRGFVDFRMQHGCGGIVAVGVEQDPTLKGSEIEQARSEGRVIRMPTVTLAEVLDDQHAPEIIDFFSLDVEGAEFRVLSSFPFDRYRFRVIVVEKPGRELNDLLRKSDYIFVKRIKINNCYVHQDFYDDERFEGAASRWKTWPVWDRQQPCGKRFIDGRG